MKTWLITGCSSGLGRGIAEAALKHGENVAVTARNVEQIKELAEQYPVQAQILRLDLNDRESMKNAVDSTRKVFGGIGVLADRYRKENLVNHHDQLGDPMKGGEVIVDTILSEKIPSRLLLGSDAVQTAQNVLKDRLQEIEDWMDVSRRSDYR